MGSPDWVYVVVGIFAAIGVPIMAMGDLIYNCYGHFEHLILFLSVHYDKSISYHITIIIPLL